MPKEKSPDAYRTIGEVSEFLNLPTHVLRYWGNRFPEVSPTIGRGSRRLYRPRDVALLAGLKKLLRDDGMTIRGAQKILSQRGKEYVVSLAETDTAPSNPKKESGSVHYSPPETSKLEAAPSDKKTSAGAKAEIARKLYNEIQGLRNRLAGKTK